VTLRHHLMDIFEADRAAREAEAKLFEKGEPEALAELLAKAAEEALAEGDPQEAQLRLTRLADLCAQVPGPQMADTLLAMLDHDDPAVRVEAGEALKDVAYERFKEVARAIERRLDQNHRGVGMQELPFVLTEIYDPDPVPLLLRFLSHPEAEVVAAAITALADYGDPRAIDPIRKLENDDREAELEDFEDETTRIGDLAREAIEELEGESDA
jgi:HEAT repeat protein